MIYEMIVIPGLILIFIAIVGGKKIEIEEVKIGDLTNTQRSIIGVVGIIVVVLGFWQPTVPTFTPTITVKITSPQEDAIISYNNTTVSGIASNVPEDKYLWVIVKKAGDNKFYPCDGWRPIHEDEWNVQIWLPKPNKKCSIFAYLADKQANEELKNHVNTRIGHPGMLSLPDVVESYDRINVTWNPS